MFISIRIRSRKIIVRGCGSSGSFREYDIRITVDEVRTQCDRREDDSLVDLVAEKNPLLSYNKVHMVKPPSSEMDQFGDTVVVIKEHMYLTNKIIIFRDRAGLSQEEVAKRRGISESSYSRKKGIAQFIFDEIEKLFDILVFTLSDIKGL